jgi:hypothetical protein
MYELLNKSLIQKKTTNLYIFQIDFDNEKSVDLDLKSCIILDFRIVLNVHRTF